MKRRKFLKIVGIGAATPTIIIKAVIEGPRYLISSCEIGPMKEIKYSAINPHPFSHLVKSDVMLNFRELFVEYWSEELDKKCLEILNA